MALPDGKRPKLDIAGGDGALVLLGRRSVLLSSCIRAHYREQNFLLRTSKDNEDATTISKWCCAQLITAQSADCIAGESRWPLLHTHQQPANRFSDACLYIFRK